MKKVLFCAILSLPFFVGYDEQSMQQVDRIVQDVNEISIGAEAILQSPAGELIPPGWRIGGLLAVQLVNGLVIAWQEWRNRNMKKTAKAIVKGIEQTENPEKATSEVKANIADEMIKQGGQKFYDRANKIVDQLKIS